MIARCQGCGFIHMPGDPRCENAARIGAKLKTRLAVSVVPPVCPHARHLQFKQSIEAFVLNSRKWTSWDDGVDLMMQANCKHCGATLAYHVGPSDQRLAAAVDLLKETP